MTGRPDTQINKCTNNTTSRPNLPIVQRGDTSHPELAEFGDITSYNWTLSQIHQYVKNSGSCVKGTATQDLAGIPGRGGA